MRRILLLSTTTGYQADAVLVAAREMDVEVLLGTDRCHVLTDPWGDGAIALRFDDPEGNAAILASHQFDGVVALGDAPVETACLVAGEFHTRDAARAGHDKLRARCILAATELNVPAFATASLHSQPDFPCVLKPTSMSASRGVIRANSQSDYRVAYELIRSLGRGEILVEDYIPGIEFALEGIVQHGELHVLALFDKPDPLDGPYFEETIYVTPSRLPQADQTEIVRTVARGCEVLGFRHGPIHAEVRWNERGAWILEIAGRPIGGLCSRALRFDGGMSLEQVIVRHALGEDVSVIQRDAAPSGVMMIPVPAAGVFRGVDGLDEARAVAGVTSIEITAKIGQAIEPWPTGSSYLGFIFASGEHPLREAHQTLRFRIDASLPVLR